MTILEEELKKAVALDGGTLRSKRREKFLAMGRETV